MWFAVPVYFQSSEPLGNEVLIEEAIYLIEAESEIDASEKAKAVGLGNEHRYRNVQGREVEWSLDSVGKPWELLDDPVDGAELFSRFLKGSELKSLREPFPEE